MKDAHRTDAATGRVLAGILDPELAARYPDRTHFIASDNPEQGALATRALFAGEPVVIVFPDGHEILMTPQHAAGLVGLMLMAAALLTRLRRRRGRTAEVIQFPSARIEARDASGQPIAA